MTYNSKFFSLINRKWQIWIQSNPKIELSRKGVRDEGTKTNLPEEGVY